MVKISVCGVKINRYIWVELEEYFKGFSLYIWFYSKIFNDKDFENLR